MSRHLAILLGLASALGLSAAYAQSTGINPYTGQPASLETLARELETAKAQTAVLEERVRQAQLGMQLNLVPLKQRAELEQLELQSKQISQALAPPPPPVQQAPVVQKPVKPAPPPEPVVKLSSVIRSGNDMTALLDVNGQTMAVKTGDKTQFGPVVILNEGEVRVGVMRLTVSDYAISRFTQSDNASELSSGAMQPMMLPPPIPAPAQ